MVGIAAMGSSLIGGFEHHAGILAGFWQLVSKDVLFAQSTSKWNGWSSTKIGQDLVNMVTGRIFGITVWPAVSNYPRTFQLGQAVNPLSIFGFILWLAHQAGLVSARVGKLGGAVAIGAAVGGIFDDPIPSMSSSPYVGMIQGSGQMGFSQTTPIWAGGT